MSQPVSGGRRPLVVYADGPDGPLPDPAAIASLTGLVDPELLLGWVVRTPGWLKETAVPVSTLLTGSGLRSAIASGLVRSTPARLSSVPGLLAGARRPAVAVVGAVADGTAARGSRWRTLANVGWATAAASAAGAVVVERWPAGAGPAGPTPRIEGHVVEVVERTDPPDPQQSAEPGEAERTIGHLVAGLLPDGATIQWGPGALGAAFVDAIDRPVAVHSGVVTDELAGLAERGLLTGTAVAAYVWGGERLADLHRRNHLRVAPVEVTHDLTAIGRIPRFVAVNTALEVGLDGSVNVEVVGGRVVSGPGGHPDFSLGASRSPGGLSVVVLRAGNAERSGIVERTEVVSTPRTDIDVVVTEHGVADLRDLDDRERGLALAGVAHGAHRERLRSLVS